MMSGVQPTASAPQPPSETSSKTTGLSHQCTKPASPEKKERRRKQVLQAQRAYRARNEANITALKQRVAHLESALERMGKAVVDLSDILAEKRVLTSHPNIADRLRDTLKTCLDSAKYGKERHEDFGHSQPNDTSLRVQRPVDKQSSPKYDPKESPLPINSTRRSAQPHNRFLPFELDGAASPERFSEIPFFKLGGTGTHYRGALVSNQNKSGLEEQHFPVVHSALSAFPPEAQEELDGEWFDLWDLVGYLRAETITLSLEPPNEETTHRTVNVVDFTAALVEKGICLGYSPGFKRSDVETAITLSSWT
ncbi:uncharacterized protein BHQ10_004102 [Talaromyces amestolkiae]|uniref:BZIP domain-containing protein n=1 Tax=Talaromyces amestolkiae TaxID=1196081 RepID=A0A364KX18_TALAM|nr:uncharacterized protein BHQ10_004102 [Talaromyces amestolkiae]RAO68090.1 hypothetical protein BHQ10_004102 [Talaromyces amestolkiae]